MRWLVLAAIALVTIGAVQANFAAAPGFSGRIADCTSCHRPPVEGDDARVSIDGLPEAWDPDTTYALSVTVSGGPTTIPGGPQAGFEAETLLGTLHATGPGTRTFHAKQATYTEDGVFQRSWEIAWQAPDLAEMPMANTLWIAGMAANGNHNVQINASDLGEHGDSVHNTSYVIPPSDAAWDAWRAIPLQSPVIERVEATATGHTLYGRMLDANATHVEVYDGQAWQSRSAAASWRLHVQSDEPVRLRAAGSERVSAELIVDLQSGTAAATMEAPAGQDTPAAVWPFLLPFIPLLWRRP